MLPELASPQAFHAWFQEQVERGVDPLRILEFLRRDPSELSLCRQLNVAHWSNLSEEAERLTDACFGCSDPRIEAYALGLDAYVRIAKFDTSGGGYNLAALNFLPMLRGTLRSLADGQLDLFTREAESVVRVALSIAYFFNREFEKAAEEASRGLYWAIYTSALRCIPRARSMIISINGEMGRVGDALTLLEEQKRDPNRPELSRRFHERAHAVLLYQLGQNQQPLEILRSAAHVYERGDVRPLSSELQRQQLLLGIGGMEGEIVRAFPTHALDGWVSESMRMLVEVAAMPRIKQTFERRKEFLAEAVAIWREDHHAHHAWTHALGRWVTGIAHLWQGHTSLARGIIQDAKVDHTQWLDLRLLIAGLELEVALHLNHPEISPERALNRLHGVFADARHLPLASAEGLAERLIHWHPLAAAFAALAPSPIIDLQTATRAVLRVGASNRVYDLTLPPAYAAELVLRALDYDLRPNLKFIQADPGPSRTRRKALIMRYGSVDYWRPSLSAVSLIYGLVKLGHREKAHAIYHEYGVAPHSTAEYVMLPLVEHLRDAVSQLLTDRMNVKQFSYKLLNLD